MVFNDTLSNILMFHISIGKMSSLRNINLHRGMFLTPGIQHYFSYIVPVCFIGEGNWTTRAKPQTSNKLHHNFISTATSYDETCYSVLYFFVFHFIPNLSGDINDPEKYSLPLERSRKHSLPPERSRKYSLRPEKYYLPTKRYRKVFLTPK